MRSAAAVGLAVTVALTTASMSRGEPMSGPRFATESPIAVRGSVLMVPLAAERDGDGWPSELTLSLDDGRELRGLVAWVHPAPPPARRRWTDDPRGLAVRAVVAGDDTSDAASGAAYLLAELPPETGSRLRLGQDSVTPRWRDPVGRAAAGEPLPLTEATDRPDPDSPFEYWRWVLLADRLDQAAPRPDAYGEIGSLVARHYADLWRVALDRLDRANPRVRQRCLDLLTGVGFDGPHAFGLWVIDPAEVGRLLALLLDDDRRDREVVISASNWADGPGLLAFRVAPRDPSKVALAVATPGEVPGEAHLSWLGSPTTVAEPVLLAPGQLQRLELEPPAAPAAPGTVDLGDRDPEVRVLVVEAAGRRQQMTFPTGAVPARPPGVLFTLRPTLTLADARSGWQRGLRDDRATNVQIRKLGRRWEVFVECLRPSPPAGAESEEKGSAPVEAVILFFGGEPARAVLAVPERGSRRLFRGSDDATLQVHRRSYEDRWYCRVVVPEPWLAGTALVGAVRTHGDQRAVETGPYASLPWRRDPGRAVIDLRSWDEVGQ